MIGAHIVKTALVLKHDYQLLFLFLLGKHDTPWKSIIFVFAVLYPVQSWINLNSITCSWSSAPWIFIWVWQTKLYSKLYLQSNWYVDSLACLSHCLTKLSGGRHQMNHLDVKRVEYSHISLWSIRKFVTPFSSIELQY